jgi:ElaB/YqjD/DUF883 family membrane-anchored ribosome-binding protein
MSDQPRDLADQDPATIQHEIDETRSSITSKLEAIEEQVVGTVQNARESVQETLDTVKETVQETVTTVKETFDLRLQVERHPWPMLGASLAAGVLTGAWIGEGRRRRRMPVERLASHGHPTMERYPERETISNGRTGEEQPGLFSRFQDEIDRVKGVALGMALGLVRDVIQENVPRFEQQIGEVMNNITTKLGGEPVRGPVLQSEAFRTH